MQRIKLHDQDLEYTWSGDPLATPTLIFLHEGLGCAAMWKDFPAQLARQTSLPTLAYSRAGYGGSSPVPPTARPASYLRHEAAVTLPALLAQLNLQDVILIGHSDGASIALLYAALFPSPRLKGVIVEAPHSFVEPLSLQNIQAAQTSFLRADLRERLARYHHENVDGAFWGWSGMWLSEAFQTWNIEDELPKITAPLLAIQGHLDEYGTMRQIETIIERCARAESLLLEECGHSPHKAQPQATLEAMTRFILSHR